MCGELQATKNCQEDICSLIIKEVFGKVSERFDENWLRSSILTTRAFPRITTSSAPQVDWKSCDYRNSATNISIIFISMIFLNNVFLLIVYCTLMLVTYICWITVESRDAFPILFSINMNNIPQNINCYWTLKNNCVK